jgi:hypothetical protein
MHLLCQVSAYLAHPAVAREHRLADAPPAPAGGTHLLPPCPAGAVIRTLAGNAPRPPTDDDRAAVEAQSPDHFLLLLSADGARSPPPST